MTILKFTAFLMEALSYFLNGLFSEHYVKYALNLGPCLIHYRHMCDTEQIRFYFYSQKNKVEPEILHISDTAPPTFYDPTAKTKVLIHGYAGNFNFSGVVLIRDAYLSHGNYNIIIVDWGLLVPLPCYPTAVLNTWQAGICLAALLENLYKFELFNVHEIHFVGFSLGAHVASFASNELERRIQRQIGRITGLDPALPFFATVKSSWKLDHYDAKFVDIIHTNSGIFGKIEPSGHVDFYVNGGSSQPTCWNAANVHLCSHLMATIYFAESIFLEGMDKQFYGFLCSNYLEMLLNKCQNINWSVVMGNSCSHNVRGVYYIETANKPPFAMEKRKTYEYFF